MQTGIANFLSCGPSKSVLYVDSISLNVRILLLQHRQNHTDYVHSQCYCKSAIQLLDMFLNQSKFNGLSSIRTVPPPAKCIQRHTIISSVLSCRNVMRLSAVIVGRHVSNSISGRTTDQRHGSYEVASGTGRRGVDTGQVDVDRL